MVFQFVEIIPELMWLELLTIASIFFSFPEKFFLYKAEILKLFKNL